METPKPETFNMSREQFDKDLELCLVIQEYPTKETPFYVCEYTSPSLYKKVVHIIISK